jgi:CpXC protein
MSTFRPYTVQCVCRHTFRTDLAVAVNAVRMPHLRAAILAGRLHRVTCPFCSRTFTVEKQFVYADLTRGSIIRVLPPGQSFRWRQESATLDEDLAKIDFHGTVNRSLQRRLVFGIGELRDKLIAQDCGLDDRHVELAKVLVIHEHPVLLSRPRLRLFLNTVRTDRLEFFAGYDHTQQAFSLSIPRFAYDRLAKGDTAQAWVDRAHEESIFSPANDQWVSIQRWAPANSGLNSLHDDAEAVRQGKDIDLDSDDFKTMLSSLPSGSQLPSSAKIDLRDVESYANAKGRADIQEQLFKIRFGFQLADDWGLNNQPAPGDIDGLWDLLKSLPDTNVEGNSHIREIILEHGDGGGSYDPSSDDIEVSTAPTDANDFQNTIRHEVGHAVQDKLDNEQNNLVTNFLADHYGWQVFGAGEAGAQAWAQMMDGWTALSNDDQGRICDLLIAGLGPGGSWNPPPPPNPAQSSPWWGTNFGPRLALEGTLQNWYDSNDSWYRKDGRAYFLNYWYQQFMSVPTSLLDFINTKMPWDYAAMSPSEFFAETYALFYRLDAPKRGNLPEDVQQWFTDHVGAPRADAPAVPPPQPDSMSESSDSPGGGQNPPGTSGV